MSLRHKPLQDFINRVRRAIEYRPAMEEQICFVISSPRSGSTWLERSINSHPDVYCTENRLFGHFCEIWQDCSTGLSTVRITMDEYWFRWSRYQDTSSLPMDRDELYKKRFSENLNNLLDFQRRASGKNIIVDKITPYLGTSETVLSSIKRHFPTARLVQLKRDGRDVLTSGVFDWIKKQDCGSLRYEKYVRGANVKLNRLFQDNDIEMWSKYWMEPLDAWEKTGISPDLSITYEDLIQDMHVTLQNFFSVINCKATKKQIRKCVSAGNFEIMSGGRKAGQEISTAKARKGIVGDWKNYFTLRDGELFENLTQGWLVKTGYEICTDWWKTLPEEISI